jgi:DnaD/phage-associated family protein
MQKFKGFSINRMRWVNIPEIFYVELLPLIDDVGELKVMLFFLRALNQKGGEFRYLRRRDFTGDAIFMRGLAAIDPAAGADAVLDAALARSVERGSLLLAEARFQGQTIHLYFLNTHRGRIAARQIKAVNWLPGDLHNPVEILPPRLNIFELYEADFGMVTPKIAEYLKDAEAEYPAQWVAEAMAEAVAHNKRNWSYVRAILDNWERNGRGSGIVERRAQPDGAGYISGEFAAFIKYKPDEP